MSDKKTSDNVICLERLKKLIDKDTRENIAKAFGCDTSLITKHYTGKRDVTAEYIVKYAKYFNVSADYLLGLTDAKTNNANMRMICDYTGLSESAVNGLSIMKHARGGSMNHPLLNTERNSKYTLEDMEATRRFTGLSEAAVLDLHFLILKTRFPPFRDFVFGHGFVNHIFEDSKYYDFFELVETYGSILRNCITELEVINDAAKHTFDAFSNKNNYSSEDITSLLAIQFELDEKIKQIEHNKNYPMFQIVEHFKKIIFDYDESLLQKYEILYKEASNILRKYDNLIEENDPDFK